MNMVGRLRNKESETLSTSITVEFTDIKGIFKHRDIEYWYCEE